MKRMTSLNQPQEIGSEFSISLEIFKLKDRNELENYLNLKKNRYMLFNSGRTALKFYLKEIYLKKKAGKVFLLPAYLCGSIIQPFKELKIPYRFYKINQNLEIDYQYLKQSITNSVGGILFIHYFGFTQNEIIKKLYPSLKRFGIEIVEDITHSILSKKTEEYGGYIFSSLRKIFPLPDGGLLKSNKASLPRHELNYGYN